ncbi:MAG: ABC transporter ATP-binding protein [Yaniella sp.]|uniref:ABC transporter ATP-binding protein n=1 Tax=Yaniella sp. TaxID=2773929 RepID=UPI0026496411|nr:ABC transporter ATP-binding protein [Yaniella sp.]MDN5731473.1 ABC transporter ATP-binding protein [Yaniella sp.]MDN5814869.1 ABC transporter ATP-binding protein [Yaniella sp.]MDN5817756.1 ABC transporter ATP-binding protein [Yaniella sp.]MDN5838291.1 ABC transporter ATP-binding protein [Yaniella sp.]MDN5911878.1 ABC transporter ATP-binding protein [Yaniella sp.]
MTVSPTQSPPLLETENLARVFGAGMNQVTALKGLTFEIQQGESVAIIGKSGSGKSTLMHLLALLDQPSSGVVAMRGNVVSDLTPKEIAKVRNTTFGFVFQQFYLNSQETVLENVTLPLKIAKVPKAERNRRGIEVLEQLDMGDKIKAKATNLSGGQQQRVSIGRALINSPEILFADEPTGNLDSETSAVVEDLLFGLNAEGQTLIVVTHDEDLAIKCDRQIRIQDGLIIEDKVANR